MHSRKLVAAIATGAAVLLTIGLRHGDHVDRSSDAVPTPAAIGATSRVLIDLADDLSDAEREAFIAARASGAQPNSEFSDAEGLVALNLPSDRAAALIAALRDDPHVEHVELDQEYAAFGDAAPNDPLYPFQWDFDQIDVPMAWRLANGAGAVVAVLDTGVAYTNGASARQVRDLAGTAFVEGYDFVDDDRVPLDEHGHGTHVAGTVAQTTNNGYGVAGVAPRAAIMPIRVLDARGRGRTSDIAEAVRFAADRGANVINLSLGGGMPSAVLRDAVAYARGKGVTVIAAAGNSSTSAPSYPAAYPGVVSVAATQFDRTTAFYSNYGTTIDIAAPGGNTRIDQNDDGRPDGILQETLRRGDPREHEFALYMGTSMASPHVAAVAALLYSAGVTNPDRVEAILVDTASREVPSFDPVRYGAGIVDAGRAVGVAVRDLQAPRAALAMALAGLLAAAAGRRRRDLHFGAVSIAAVFAATGLALPVLGAGLAGLDVSPLAGLATTPLRWLSPALGPFGDGAVLLSFAPAIGVYALTGGSRSRVAAGATFGAMVGIAAALLGAGLALELNVVGVPGTGLLDRAWLVTNGVLTLGAAAAAARAR